ncbi:alpha/beta fold hydrolase [Phaeobacter sp. QD34_3]|uniref:alpha/beta hydrolase n=1 Tax=unclassified Phaeobacter TaxID=2621772 RepID=UPI00237F0AB3|nr:MULTISPECIES: alpha/beta fold hydrolase [unclassified Phaeobacter]MDE4131994.1 alpha/beta fold hydrolase [Phaeobacter sp. QD34_3]MDE4135632.1 alpha/beta fold hydrolase [Phaeobacter sp. QD34_24]MDE4173621.1 alpha/beta fold hydrolase [Phaeobacter sp. PT47_59]
MEGILGALGKAVLGLGVLGAGLWTFGPYEPVDLKASFDPAKFDGGVAAYFERVEGAFSDITPGTEKRVIWAGEPEARTPVSVVYIHGFSGTSEEIRPVPDRVAQALGANLVYTRLAGHGRPGSAMAEPTVNDWMQDLAEALAAARKVGERVVVIATSTGATLMTAAALDPELSRDLAGIVMVSPNYGINHPVAALLTWPAARHWLPLLAGKERSFPARSPEHERFWTTSYPSVAAMPMAALVKAVTQLKLEETRIPALFWFSEKDQVVRPDLTQKVAARWGGLVKLQNRDPGPDDDPYAHVMAGDVMSPGQTDTAVQDILSWLSDLEVK